MNKKISLGLALSLIAIASAVTFILTSFFSLQSFNKTVVDVSEKGKKYNSLQTLDSYVREHYLGDIDESELNDGILKGYISGLGDKYSKYLSEEEYLTEQNEGAGQLVGLGLTLTEDESGYIRIAGMIQDSPVTEAGLMVGDIITLIDGVSVLSVGFDESVEAMRGTEGSEIRLTVRRGGVDKDYTFTRRSIEEISVTGEMISEYVGYIKVTGFKKNTPQQFMNALERLTSNGVRALIFDVRDNGGGIVPSLSECLDPLLPEGVIATAEYKDGHSETIVYSDETMLDIPMVVLVNKNTASAAELFAASLRDFASAYLIGEKTYGKGVMQETTEFNKNGAVILTVARYKTSLSDCYDGVGIAPDLTLANEDPETDDQKNKAVEIAYSLIQ
ncbi:MAG: PDZ domain-containing protein [Ruminococcus sp.]|jgi:carboxyl-terminal processing protease|uniref:S41 family peptidase n=1 Tax=Ruminococcus sp. TaxID=41978 RepID=UPI001AFEFCFC|nr:S41 family peptidase [Ruminococcus sp.]MBO7474158.1 PDZ domain-containing protein [Ruminococcus sp.]